MDPSRRSVRVALAFACLAFALPEPASASLSKLDARSRSALARVRTGRESAEQMRGAGAAIGREGTLEVFVRGPASREALEGAGARVRTALPGLCTASIPASAIGRVAALEGVTAIRAGAPCQSELDASVPATGIPLLRGAGPDFAGLGGEGVIVGMVDTGIDLHHGDFQDPGGATRILFAWDQVATGPGPPGMPYPYGIECSSAQINAGTCLETDTDEHGTHVAGIAAGDGSQTGGSTPAFTYAGMAPGARLVVVKTDFFTPDVLDAVAYVFDKATARGEAAVVNLSLGTHFGSHDGASDFEQGISALTGPGRIVVKSAGNDRGKPLHAQVLATPGGASATVSVAGSASGRYFGADGCYASTERLRIQVLTPNGTRIGPLAVGNENAAWPGQSTANGYVYVAHDSLDTARKNVYFEVNATGTQNMNGTWTITFFADQLGPANGEVDLWRFLLAPGLTADFVAGNLPTQELVTEPGNATGVITVGAWVTKTGWIGCNGVATGYAGVPPAGSLAPFSSPGPTRDGRLKPELAAPGSAIASAASFDVAHACPPPPAGSERLDDGMNHRMLQGTSVAAPHAAGAAAVLMQKRGALTPAEVASYLESQALADAFTGAVPNNDWGYGKLRLGDLVDPAVHVLSPNENGQVAISDTLSLSWIATDSLGSVSSVDLQLSRSGPGGPFEDLALGIPNTGSASWVVTGPTTGTYGAFLRARAHDTNGNTGSDVSDAGFTIMSTLGVDEAALFPFALESIVPSPASGPMDIVFSVPREARVRLRVFDVQGRWIATLREGSCPAGRHHVRWGGPGRAGRACAGLYFLRLDTPEGQQVRRVIFAP